MSPQCCFVLFCCSFLSQRAVLASPTASRSSATDDSSRGDVSQEANSSSFLPRTERGASKEKDNHSVLLSSLSVNRKVNVPPPLTQRAALERAEPPPTSTDTLLPKTQRPNRTPPSAMTATITAAPNNASETNKHNWYHTGGDWLPRKGFQDRSVNLSVVPMLAFAAFLFGICIKCYSWVRDQDRTKARGQLDFEDADELNYTIITAGEQGYREVDLRSDTTSMYDTVTSFRSFRLPPFSEQLTVTSIKSLPNQPFNTYRSIILQKANEGVYDSVHSYKAFLEKAIKMSDDVDIEVEEVDNYSLRPRSKSYSGTETSASRSRRRRMRRHSGGRGIEGGAKTMAEKERVRRHSGNSVPHPNALPVALRGKGVYRRSSPAILEPLVQEGESRSHTGPSDDEDLCVPLPASVRPHFSLDRQSSNSSSSTGGSSSSSTHRRRPKDPSITAQAHKQRREKLRQKRASQDKLADKPAKGTQHHRPRRGSDDSPRSSSPSECGSSNEVDSESDVTDSGLVMDLPHADLSPSPKLLEFPKSQELPNPADLPKPVELPEKLVELLKRPVKQSCFKHKGNGNGHARQHHGSRENGEKVNTTRKVARFKVSFVGDADLSPTSD